MFFNVFNRAIVCAGFFALTACGGGEPADTPTNSVQPASHSVVQQSAVGQGAGSATGQGGGALRLPPAVSMAEREAEQLRMVPYEQAFALEMQRRAQERPEHLHEQPAPAPAPDSALAPAQTQTVCDAALQVRPADCIPTQPGAVTESAGQAL
ncbi:MAG TPA: hypothetical protein VF800_14920 [Telluria sp.]|jgi:hypothetical protein